MPIHGQRELRSEKVSDFPKVNKISAGAFGTWYFAEQIHSLKEIFPQDGHPFIQQISPEKLLCERYSFIFSLAGGVSRKGETAGRLRESAEHTKIFVFEQRNRSLLGKGSRNAKQPKVHVRLVVMN